MNNYISIKSVLNYISDSIREEAGDTTLIKYAFQGYRQNISTGDLLKKELDIVPLINHKANLNCKVKRLNGVYHINNQQANQFSAIDPFLKSELVTDDSSEASSFLGESAIVPFTNLMHYCTPLFYKGQDSYVVNNKYISFYDNCCEHGFTINRKGDCITADIKDGFLLVEKMQYVRDDDGDYLIPDNADLQQALAYFAEAQSWRERANRKEQGAEQLFQTRMQMAQAVFNAARGKRILKSFDPNAMNRLVFDRFAIQKHPYISQAGRNQFI